MVHQLKFSNFPDPLNPAWHPWLDNTTLWSLWAKQIVSSTLDQATDKGPNHFMDAYFVYDYINEVTEKIPNLPDITTQDGRDTRNRIKFNFVMELTGNCYKVPSTWKSSQEYEDFKNAGSGNDDWGAPVGHPLYPCSGCSSGLVNAYSDFFT